MIDPFAPSDSLEDLGFLVVALSGNEDGHRTPDSFLRRISENPLGPAVPARNDPIQVFTNYRIVGRIDDRGEPASVGRDRSSLGNVTRYL
jgi:hypothetical protein